MFSLGRTYGWRGIVGQADYVRTPSTAQPLNAQYYQGIRTAATEDRTNINVTHAYITLETIVGVGRNLFHL